MDVVSAASDLRMLLVAHDNSYNQMAALDEYITGMSQRQFLSSLEGQQSQTLHLALRLSLSEGVHSMYSLYTSKKWSQVQHKARSITAALHSEEEVDQPLSSTQQQGSVKTDKAAATWPFVNSTETAEQVHHMIDTLSKLVLYQMGFL